MNEEGVIDIYQLFEEFQKTGAVKVPQILMKPFVQREIGKVFKVFLNNGIFRKKADIIFYLGADDAFAKNNNKRVEQI